MEGKISDNVGELTQLQVLAGLLDSEKFLGSLTNLQSLEAHFIYSCIEHLEENIIGKNVLAKLTKLTQLEIKV